jgi:tetratricopeptide (TPR) repeat protein
LVPRATGGALMETLLDLVPDHPAGQHYLIHAYDIPSLASGALDVARSYGALAPRVPHALHMPTHIYTQLGLWPESVELNELSAAAAWEQGPLVEGLDIAYGHPLGYLIYAYLQRGQDVEASTVRDRVLAVEGPFGQLNRTTFAAHLAGIPVRYALERHEWEEAAELETRLAAGFPWDEGFSEYDAVTYFGRALGHARSGNPRGAREALEQLRTTLDGPLAQLLSANGPVLLLSAEAWVMYSEGDQEAALTTMTVAAERSTSLTWAGLSEFLPAGELLGDMYLDLGRHSEALTAYDAVLQRQPSRLNSLCGAARAAELAGDRDLARSHYGALAQVTDLNSPRDCLVRGRAFLDAAETIE